MMMPLSRQRFQIAIPAQGMIEVRDALTDLLKEFGTDDLCKNCSSIFFRNMENLGNIVSHQKNLIPEGG